MYRFTDMSNDEFLDTDEKSLQKQLKRICDSKGRETNTKESAAIFNKLGLLYKSRSPDKINLIQSAALFNAAIVRQSLNEKFQSDLHDLCRHVLECANAKLRDANLLDISKSSIQTIQEMRRKVNVGQKQLKQLQRQVENAENEALLEEAYVERVKSLQKQLSTDYKCVMASISRQCFSIMGTPPCKYALVGMGSLARDEISPYSDFEHVLTLSNPSNHEKLDESIKEYFRWYSVIFHIVVICMQETDLYSVCIPSLNDHSNPDGNWFYDNVTRQGISFDGMMPHACHFPLGKTQKSEKQPWTTELIQSVDEMVKYLEAKDIKKGYKLSDLLTKTCFVEGDESLFKDFSEGIQRKLMKDAPQQMANILSQLEEDLKNFDLGPNLLMFTMEKSINIKRIIYRSITLFISALGRLNNVTCNSGFDIIEEFKDREVINDYAAHRLTHAVAVACHIRLSYYMSKNRQDDTIYKENESWGNEKLAELLSISKASNLVNCLATSAILQEMLKTKTPIDFFNEKLKNKESFSKMHMLNFLGIYDEVIKIGERYLKDSNVSMQADLPAVLDQLGDAYIRSKQYSRYEAMVREYKTEIMKNPDMDRPYSKLKYNELSCLFLLRRNKEQISNDVDAALRSDLRRDERLNFLYLDGLVKGDLHRFHDALRSFKELLQHHEQTKLLRRDIQRGLIMSFASGCLVEIGRKKQALHLAREGLNFVEMIGAMKECRKWFTVIIDKYQHSL